MEGPLDLGLKRERRLRPIFPTAGFLAGIAGLDWRRGVGGVTVGREGAGDLGGVIEVGGATGILAAGIDGTGGGEGGFERGGGGGFP